MCMLYYFNNNNNNIQWIWSSFPLKSFALEYYWANRIICQTQDNHSNAMIDVVIFVLFHFISQISQFQFRNFIRSVALCILYCAFLLIPKTVLVYCVHTFPFISAVLFGQHSIGGSSLWCWHAKSAANLTTKSRARCTYTSTATSITDHRQQYDTSFGLNGNNKSTASASTSVASRNWHMINIEAVKHLTEYGYTRIKYIYICMCIMLHTSRKYI